MTPEQDKQAYDIAIRIRDSASASVIQTSELIHLLNQSREPEKSSILPKIFTLLIVGVVSLLLGSSYHGYPMATTKAELEADFEKQAEEYAAKGDFHSVILTGQKLQDSGFKAVGFYWEGVGNYNLGEKEAAAHFFSRSAKLGHPLAPAAYKKARE